MRSSRPGLPGASTSSLLVAGLTNLANGWKIRRLIGAGVGKIALPLGILIAAWRLHVPDLGEGRFAYNVAWALGVVAYLAWAWRGRVRDGMIVVGSVLICVLGIELYALVTNPLAIDERPTSFTRRELGWGPAVAGKFRHARHDARDGRLIYEVEYTIDRELTRQVIAAPSGPSVAFFGDSFTFGEGLAEADTLPQQFADTTGRRWRVLNLGMSGYGPQQFLRALEIGLFADALREMRVAVFQTSAWQAERTSCTPRFTTLAPRYEMLAGAAVYRGSCQDRWRHRVRWALMGIATSRLLLRPLLEGVGRSDIDLYIAVVMQAAALVREKYGAPTVILYLPTAPGYLDRAGTSDREIMERLRAGGMIVIDGALKAKDFPGQDLTIPGDEHPTGVANRARAALLREALAAPLR